jgi:peptide chain release factor 3
MKAKHLGRALVHLAEEGAAQVFRLPTGTDWIVGVAGPLQFDVLADRIRTEYDLPVEYQPSSFQTARWLAARDRRELERFLEAHAGSVAEDFAGHPVYLAPNAFRLKVTMEDWPQLEFLTTRDRLS